MKVYLAGERETPAWVEDERMHWLPHVKRRLFSYFYHGFRNQNRVTRDVQHTHDLGIDLFLDSGAFTAFTKGAVISIEQYADYINSTSEMWTVKSCLDAIGDAAGTYDNFRALRSLGCDVAPVFHCREDVSWLVKYLDEGHPYLLLGGMVPETTRWLREWLDWLWGDYLTHADGTPRLKVHGFGLTDQQLMFRYPWHSVDSSSWLMTGVFGSCVFTTPQGLRKVVFSDESPEARKFSGWHYRRLPPVQREEVDRWIEPTRLTAEELCAHYYCRDVVNARTYQMMEALGAERFIRKEEGLFSA